MTARHAGPFENLTKDLVFAFRQLIKHKGSSLLAVAVLALGIGGATAVFSVADKVLLHPIPGPNSDRLIGLHEFDAQHEFRWNVSPPLIQEIASHSNLIEGVTYYLQGSGYKKYKTDQKVLKLSGVTVAPNFFDLLEIKPLLGGLFPSGDAARDAGDTIILSEGHWRSLFGADPGVIGRRILLDDQSFLVVGVMPATVQFPFGPEYGQFWMAHSFTSQQINSEDATRDRVWGTIVRAQRGVRLPSVQAMLDTIAAQRSGLRGNADGRWVIQARPAGESFAGTQLSLTVWCLLAMTGALLLIACANVGSLLISRTLARRGEFSVRLALGASRFRLAGQLLVENFTLAAISAALGLFVAWGGVIALEQFYLTRMPRLISIGLDWKVLGLTCLASTLAGLLFGIAPALTAARTNLIQGLKDATAQQSRGLVQRLFHDGLIVSQVGLAVVLLAGACLMTQSVTRLLSVDPGLQPKSLYRVYYDAIDFMNHQSYDFQAAIKRGVPRKQAGMEAWQAQVDSYFLFQKLALEQIQSLPGVESAAVRGNAGFSDYQLENRPGPIMLGSVGASVQDGDFLRTVRARLLRGRLLSKDDATMGRQTVVINDTMASVCWPGADAIGKEFHSLDGKHRYTVVGVVLRLLDERFDVPETALFYQPFERDRESLSGVGDYVVRSAGDPSALRSSLARVGQQLPTAVEVANFYSIERELANSAAPRRVMMWLFLALGGLGLLLSALGVYAVLAFAINCRVREIGIRLALGATPGQVRGLFMRRGLRLIASGLALGLIAALAAGHYIQSLLFGVAPTDPWSLTAVSLTLGVVGGIACWVPARRAAQGNSMDALRCE